MRDFLLLFLGRADGFDGWLRIAGDEVVARGEGEAIPSREKGERLIAVAPGDQVALHWLEIPAGLTAPQAEAAARLMAAELSATPLAEMHVAVGRERQGEGRRCVALAPSASMADWLGRLRANGFDPDSIVPEPMLLPEAEEGFVCFAKGETSLYRGPGQAFAMEPELAALIVGSEPVRALDREAFEVGLTEALSLQPVDLRQGPYARRRQWRPEGRRIRRLALIGASILAVTLGLQVVTLLRYTFAADALEEEARRIAAAAVPEARGAEDPAQALGRRVEALGGAGPGFGATASAVFAAVRETPNVEVSAVRFSGDGRLHATIQSDTPATLSALVARIEAAGFVADPGSPRSGGGRHVADLTVRPR